MGRRPRTTAGGRRLPARMAAPLVLVVLVAVTVRAALYRSSLAAFIAERVEVASPLNAWKRGEGRAQPGRAGPRSLPALVLWPLRLLLASHRVALPRTAPKNSLLTTGTS